MFIKAFFWFSFRSLSVHLAAHSLSVMEVLDGKPQTRGHSSSAEERCSGHDCGHGRRLQGNRWIEDLLLRGGVAILTLPSLLITPATVGDTAARGHRGRSQH